MHMFSLNALGKTHKTAQLAAELGGIGIQCREGHQHRGVPTIPVRTQAQLCKEAPEDQAPLI